jgi:hypothetical protein
MILTIPQTRLTRRIHLWATRTNDSGFLTIGILIAEDESARAWAIFTPHYLRLDAYRIKSAI